MLINSVFLFWFACCVGVLRCFGRFFELKVLCRGCVWLLVYRVGLGSGCVVLCFVVHVVCSNMQARLRCLFVRLFVGWFVVAFFFCDRGAL